MATKKKVWLSAIATIALIAVIGLFSAFISNKSVAFPKKHHKAITLYQFNGNSTNITDPNKYTVITNPPASCSGSNLPCYLTIEDESLSSWLGSRTPAQVVADATATKN